MSHSLKLFLAGICCLLVTYCEAANPPLECWHCSSDTIGAESFCDVTFKEDNIPTEMIRERHISVMRRCNSTIHSEHERAVCRKTVEETNGKTITKRFCFYTNKSDSLDHCMEEEIDKSVRRIFCQDCLTDKCNGAVGPQVIAWSAVLLPLAIAKVFV